MSSISVASCAELRDVVPREIISVTNDVVPCVVSVSASSPPRNESRSETSGTFALRFTTTRRPLASLYSRIPSRSSWYGSDAATPPEPRSSAARSFAWSTLPFASLAVSATTVARSGVRYACATRCRSAVVARRTRSR